MKVKYLASVIAFTLISSLVIVPVSAKVNVFLDGSTLKNDLNGTLSGSVKFAQTHTINAKNNSQQEMPRLTSTRDTLVMLIPTDNSVNSLLLLAKNKTGTLLGSLYMLSPQQLPRADRPSNSPNPDVVYSDKAWSQILPADWVQPGLTLEFVTSGQRSGKLNTIDIGGETQVVLQNIRIGMLTAPGPLDKNPLEKESFKLAKDYYQKIPVSELIVGNYAPITLDQVILSSGKKYTYSSDDTGGVYKGDLRENIGKGIISMGIDNSNFGFNSSKGEQQWQPGLFHQVAVHQSWGRYSNGVVRHGLSGGNGMATVYDTVGNEFSHELGHGYNMGHYPGGGKWATHNRNSGWGWDSFQNRFIANFFWNKGGNNETQGYVTPPFLGIYQFNNDTMGGGGPSSPLSKYTLHTGYTQKRIQQWLEAKAVIAPHSPSGYLIWNEQQRKMIEPKGVVYRKPDAFGVPVVTLVGYYDPRGELESYIYPALHGSYGYTYKPRPLKTGQCRAEINYANGNTDKFGLDGVRLQAGHMNKFHINVLESKQPKSVRITCPQRDMDAAFTQWKLKKFAVNKFYDWGDKDEKLGSIYYYPSHELYFSLKSKPFGYFPTTPVDNKFWTYLTDESSLRQDYQNQPLVPGSEYILVKRDIKSATVAPRAAAKIGHLYLPIKIKSDRVVAAWNYPLSKQEFLRRVEATSLEGPVFIDMTDDKYLSLYKLPGRYDVPLKAGSYGIKIMLEVIKDPIPPL
ncbi:M66 family metalloprotease [Serratia sp. M24T3]|uniref:M66 family metalloprotease n=1 Tax=Serratia sp. M24T3 TaxID=932213 RepID=UPI00025B9633|nr:M66 family metalloprotease [Serratia sp. M24T3]EIC84230.1 Peptidase M66 [Serratia sp. M24T3]